MRLISRNPHPSCLNFFVDIGDESRHQSRLILSKFFKRYFHKTLNFSLSRFAYQYQKDCFPIINVNKDALENFSTLLKEVEKSGNKASIFILYK